jgi:hypothetical protein
MGEIGSGGGSSYPTALDTNNTPEVNSPNAGKTKARAEVPNDLAGAVVAIETELGTDPAGTLTDVKTFLQTEHNADGTHDATKIVEIAGTQTITGDKTFSGTNTFSGVNTFNNEIVADGGTQTDGTHTLKTKVVDIGTWNMDSTDTKNVLHGLTLSDIRSASALVRNDSNANRYLITHGPITSATEVQAYLNSLSSTFIILTRTTSGLFDTTSFDLTSNTIDNAAAVDKGDGTVGIPITGHDFNAKDNTTIAGTTNYDGNYDIVSETANEIVITATYVAETFAGTETASWSRGWVMITYIA